MRFWFLALRPKTLTAAIVPILVATALVWAEGQNIIWSVSIFSLLAAIFIQVGTNLVNDAVDFAKGADTSERLGPQRVTQSGLLSGQKVMWGAAFCFFLAMLFGLPLVFKGGWPIFLIGIVSVIMGYAYTAGPFPLAYRGLGDLFVVLFFGLIAVGGVYYLHTDQYGWRAIVAGLQVGFLATVLIAINNLRDIEQDKKVNKLTLAVRLGQRYSKIEIILLFFFTFGLGTYWIYHGFIAAGLLPLVTLPLARRLIRDIIKHPPGIIYNQFLAKAALIQIIFGISIAIGFFSV